MSMVQGVARVAHAAACGGGGQGHGGVARDGVGSGWAPRPVKLAAIMENASACVRACAISCSSEVAWA